MLKPGPKHEMFKGCGAVPFSVTKERKKGVLLDTTWTSYLAELMWWTMAEDDHFMQLLHDMAQAKINRKSNILLFTDSRSVILHNKYILFCF